MQNTPLIVSFDLGTTSLKAALYDSTGHKVACAQEPLVLQIPQPGWAEQDPDAWWQTMGVVSKRLLAQGFEPDQIVAVTFCSQMCGTIPVDQDANVLHPALIWLDTRSHHQAKRLTNGFPKVSGYGLFPLLRWLWVTNGAPNLAGKDPISKMLWLREERPKIWEKTESLLDAKDFLILRCTGHKITTPDCAHLTWLMDSRTNQWSDVILRRLGLPKAMLPRIVPSWHKVGDGLSSEASKHLGFNKGIAVVAGAGDLNAFALAAGTLANGDPHIYLGTGGWCAAHVGRRMVDPLHAIGAIRAADPDRYLLVAAQETVGVCLDRAVSLLGLSDQTDDHQNGIKQLLSLAASSPPGANGLVFLPWLFGERVPIDDPMVRGGFLNLTLTHGPADVARAVVDGVALNMGWAALHILRLAGTSRDRPVALMGGAAQGDLMSQTLADVLGRAVTRIVDPQWAGGLGAAMCAQVALGWQTDLLQASKLAHSPDVFLPRKDLTILYQERLKRLKQAYANNRRWFRQIGSNLAQG